MKKINIIAEENIVIKDFINNNIFMDKKSLITLIILYILTSSPS